MALPRIKSLRVAVIMEHWSQELDSLTNSLTEKLNNMIILSADDEKESARLKKLVKDCKSISEQMTQLQLELEEKQSFSSFLQSVKEEDEKKREYSQFKLQEHQIKHNMLELSLEIKKAKMQELDDDLPPLMAKGSEQLGGVKKRAPDERKAIMLLIEKKAAHSERLLQEQKGLMLIKLKDEERLHEEATQFLENQSKELKQQLEKWQQTTKQLLQEKQELLNTLACKKTSNYDRLMEMKRKFKEMEQVVMEDREEQKKLRQEQMETRAATKVQAWWRGCMVRRGLGSFKNTGDSKKGKKKKTKKKEGKTKKKK